MTQSPADTNGKTAQQAPPPPVQEFDQPVVLRQSPVLSRAVIWIILIFTGVFVSWAYFARLEQVVSGAGRLEPKGDVKEVQAPVNGIVKAVEIEDGDKVKKGDLLLTFDSDAALANQQSLLEIQNSLRQENQLYRAIISDSADITALESLIIQLNVPAEVAALARNRLSLVGEAQVIRAQLGLNRGNLNGKQAARLNASLQEINSRLKASELELRQLQELAAQNKLQIGDRRTQLKTDREVLEDIRDRNRDSMAQAEESLQIDTEILETLEPLVADGAVAQLQLERQQQQVNDRTERMIDQRANGGIELQQQQQRVDSRIAEIDQLLKEQQRLQLDIRQARQELVNTSSASERNLREQLDNVEQRLALVDSELNKVIVENEKRLSEITAQLIQNEETLEYQEVIAPISGTVFDLKAGEGFVPRSGQAEPLLKIVPDDELVAEVFVTNSDIGFVRQRFDEELAGGDPVKVDVRIDTYAFNQYGDIDGEILSIGSDALPPDQIYPYYRFPIRIALDEQDLLGRPLQSGMSVNVNIKIREDRRVYSVFTDLFDRRVDDLKRSR
ncbi:secretion protein HlyD family protein [[Leptolyngbya] sp. PCC 7376]|uniref:HlyD family efflux transporter periplasmic adaptor subunit n=1 Tax=[Leptolyngbya] sp. PCC 7376 TaxID=111781 RepID=UPI00029EC4E6|nr:HlyD family efflux transporter periplasmic adaptor subunit [[Leptolyngbya] sp. PCC 7376]AFY39830.1 secretion protein HlyD family protein [[Leptolyngbya] sp. PCC 7376]